MKILIELAHPALERSVVNVQLARAAEAIAGVTVNDLYQRYPDYVIDEAYEQSLVLSHDVIIFQHPFYWYNCPGLLKEWLDQVLLGSFVRKQGQWTLEGKRLMTATTTGGDLESYMEGGEHRYEMRQLLQPFEQTARYCRMRYLPPFVAHDCNSISKREDVRPHVQDYRRILTALAEDRVDFKALKGLDRFNLDLDKTIRPEAKQESTSAGGDHGRP